MHDQVPHRIQPEADSGSPSLADIPLIDRFGIPPVLFAFLTLILVFLLYQVVGGIISLLIFGVKPTAENVVGFRFATALGQMLLIFVPTILLVRFVSRSPAEYLRIRMPDDPRTFLAAIVGMFVLQQMLQIYLFFQERLPIPEGLRRLSDQFKEMFESAYRLLAGSESLPELLAVILVIALIPAVSEELLFRGLVQRLFERGMNPRRGVILTGVVFGVYHLNPFTVIPLVGLGIYLGFLAYRSNSLWPAIVGHFFNNAYASLALHLRMEEDGLVVGSPSAMSPAMLLVAFCFLGIIFLLSILYFLRFTRPSSTSIELVS